MLDIAHAPLEVGLGIFGPLSPGGFAPFPGRPGSRRHDGNLQFSQNTRAIAVLGCVQCDGVEKAANTKIDQSQRRLIYRRYVCVYDQAVLARLVGDGGNHVVIEADIGHANVVVNDLQGIYVRGSEFFHLGSRQFGSGQLRCSLHFAKPLAVTGLRRPITGSGEHRTDRKQPRPPDFAIGEHASDFDDFGEVIAGRHDGRHAPGEDAFENIHNGVFDVPVDRLVGRIGCG